MTPSEEKKIKQLLEFYAEYGFDHSVEKIAEYLSVTPKTLYNRYQTKDKMELSAMLFWQKHFRQLLEEKCNHTNNSIEALLLIAYHIKELPEQNPHIFTRKMQDLLGPNYFGNEEMRLLVFKIIEAGKHEKSIRPELNQHAFEPYYVFGAYCFSYKRHLSSEFVEYALAPILTDKGRKMLAAIDINSYLFNHVQFPIVER